MPCLFLPQKKPARRRYENYGMYSDDDANSDASSACSERSYSSRNGGAIPTYMRQTEDVAEVSGSVTQAGIRPNKPLPACFYLAFRQSFCQSNHSSHIVHIKHC